VIAFTIFGLLVFWSVCFGAGYLLAMLQDFKNAVDELTSPVEDGCFEVIAILKKKGIA
jgi:K+-transporting ATPase A subunit